MSCHTANCVYSQGMLGWACTFDVAEACRNALHAKRSLEDHRVFGASFCSIISLLLTLTVHVLQFSFLPLNFSDCLLVGQQLKPCVSQAGNISPGYKNGYKVCSLNIGLVST